MWQDKILLGISVTILFPEIIYELMPILYFSKMYGAEKIAFCKSWSHLVWLSYKFLYCCFSLNNKNNTILFNLFPELERLISNLFPELERLISRKSGFEVNLLMINQNMPLAWERIRRKYVQKVPTIAPISTILTSPLAFRQRKLASSFSIDVINPSSLLLNYCSITVQWYLNLWEKRWTWWKQNGVGKKTWTWYGVEWTDKFWFRRRLGKEWFRPWSGLPPRRGSLDDRLLWFLDAFSLMWHEKSTSKDHISVCFNFYSYFYMKSLFLMSARLFFQVLKWLSRNLFQYH